MLTIVVLVNFFLKSFHPFSPTIKCFNSSVSLVNLFANAKFLVIILLISFRLFASPYEKTRRILEEYPKVGYFRKLIRIKACCIGYL